MEKIRRENQLRLEVYTTICKVLYIPGGAGFLPSTVSLFFQLILGLISLAVFNSQAPGAIWKLRRW